MYISVYWSYAKFLFANQEYMHAGWISLVWGLWCWSSQWYLTSFLCYWNPTRHLTHWNQDKMGTISRRYFQMHFLKFFLLILLKISLNFVPIVQINNIPASAWFRPGNKLLSEPMMVSLLMHICVAWPQWVNSEWHKYVLVNKPSLVQVMACCLTGTEPLSEPMLEYRQLDPWEQTSVKY